MIVYGRNPVREALRGRREVRRVWAAPELIEQGWLTRDAGASATLGLPVEPVPSSAALERICGSPEHQGICADAGDYPYADPDVLLAAEDALVICLDQIQDPHNLGAICRVAECAGAAGVVIPERRAAQVTPAACRTSAGAVEHLPVTRVGNVAGFLERAKRAGAWCYAAVAGAATAYDEPDYRGRVVLVLGSEGRGVRRRVASACDAHVSLPVRGRVASLNVATATAALVYGILHLRATLDRAV